MGEKSNNLQAEARKVAEKWLSRAYEHYFWMNGDTNVMVEDMYCVKLTEAFVAESVAYRIYKAIYHIERNQGTWEDIQLIQSITGNRDIELYYRELEKTA